MVGDDAGEPGPEAVRPAGSRGALLSSGAGRGAAAVARDAATVDAVTEKGERRGQHGERAEHGDRDHRHGAQADRDEVAGAGDEQAGQGDHHGESRDEDRSAHGRGCSDQRGLRHGPTGNACRPAAAAALLTLAAHVEQGVVDPDRETDENDDRQGRPAVGCDVRHQPQGTDGRDHGGEAQHERHAGGDQGAERQDEDQQRQRQ